MIDRCADCDTILSYTDNGLTHTRRVAVEYGTKHLCIDCDGLRWASDPHGTIGRKAER